MLRKVLFKGRIHEPVGLQLNSFEDAKKSLKALDLESTGSNRKFFNLFLFESNNRLGNVGIYGIQSNLLSILVRTETLG